MPTTYGFTFQDLLDSGLLEEYSKGGESKKKVEKILSRPLLSGTKVIDKAESLKYKEKNGLPKNVLKQIDKKI